MNEISTGMLWAIWLCHFGFMSVVVALVLIWALKNKQFSEQEHAARLPLEIDENNNSKE